jgi:hypothetical protein
VHKSDPAPPGRRLKRAAAKEKDPERQAELEQDLLNGDSVALLPPPIGWPCYADDDDDDDPKNGLPRLTLVMQVDMPPILAKCIDMTVFVSMIGDLPCRVTAELTEMLYKTNSDAIQLPIHMLMPTPELLTEFDRMQKFMPGENSLDAFCSAGYLSKQLNRMKSVVAGTESPTQKIILYNEYLKCCGRQGVSVILNGNLHSSSTLFAVRYIEATKDIVCGDLHRLVQQVMPELKHRDASLLADDAVWGDDTESYLYWRRTSPSTFMEKNFCVEAMLHRHNGDFFHLTAQNLKITNEVALSSLMYRIGQSNGFTYIGMPTIVADTACKLR